MAMGIGGFSENACHVVYHVPAAGRKLHAAPANTNRPPAGLQLASPCGRPVSDFWGLAVVSGSTLPGIGKGRGPAALRCAGWDDLEK
ncbi:hypothetical protein E4U30_007314 [Claviceps sp. LM220 group G6]|nr:hypothetical protein E4U30_007314 [Claviceps sp. LM220 group G6]